jgi:hypothetical protein
MRSRDDGRLTNVQIYFPVQEFVEDDSFEPEFLLSMQDLDRDPVEVKIDCIFFTYTDRWENDKLRSDLFIPQYRGFLDRNLEEMRSEIGAAVVHIEAIRSIVHNDKAKVRTDDVSQAKSELYLNLRALRDLSLDPKPRRTARSRSPARMNAAMVKRYSTILITALQETLDYTPRRGSNQHAPTLWLDDSTYLNDVAALAAELRRLNALLDTKKAKTARNSAIRFGKHVDTFLGKFSGSFGTALGVGAAGLLIGSAGALLTYAGIQTPLVNQIFSHLKGGH